MNKPIAADISLLLVAFIWGVTFVIVQNAIDLLPPFSFNGSRFTLAALFLGGWLVLFERKQFRDISPKLVLAGIFIGTWLFLGYATQTMGLLYTTSSKAGFITGLSVVLVPVFSFFLFRQRPTRNAVMGVLIATVGLYLLTMTDISALNKGDAFVFVCAIAFAMHIVVTGKYSGQFPTLALTVIQISTVAVLSLGFSFLFEDWRNAFQPSILFSKDVLVALIVTSVLATSLAFFAQTYFQKFTSPTRVALIFAMEPVFAAIAGYFWADERLSSSALIGCLFIFAGMILAELPATRLPFLKKAREKESSFYE